LSITASRSAFAPNPTGACPTPEAAWLADTDLLHGISIVTSGNPAWNVRIALAGAASEGVQIPAFRSPDYLESSVDWVECRLSDDGTEFWGVGDPSKLEFILQYFLRYVS